MSTHSTLCAFSRVTSSKNVVCLCSKISVRVTELCNWFVLTLGLGMVDVYVAVGSLLTWCYSWLIFGYWHWCSSDASLRSLEVEEQRMRIFSALSALQWFDTVGSVTGKSGSCPRLTVSRTRLSTIGDRSFHVTIAHAWNSLPTNVTASTSLLSFKRQLKTFLFTKSFPSL